MGAKRPKSLVLNKPLKIIFKTANVIVTEFAPLPWLQHDCCPFVIKFCQQIKNTKFLALRASFLSYHFLVFDLKTVSHWLILNLSSHINLYICYFLGVLQYNHLMLRLPDNLRRITRNIIRIIGRLGGKQGYAPYFQELTHYLGLRRPITIKKLL